MFVQLSLKYASCKMHRGHEVKNSKYSVNISALCAVVLITQHAVLNLLAPHCVQLP